MTLYDLAGRHVATLVDRREQPGRHRTLWRGVDGRGRERPSGTYFCRIRAPGFMQAIKISYLK